MTRGGRQRRSAGRVVGLLGLVCLGLATPPAAAAPDQVFATPAGTFIDLAPPAGAGALRLAVGQVVRLGRLEGETVIDTTAYVQQRTPEPMDSLVRRLVAAGARLVPLTDPAGQRTWIAADKVVLVRGSETRHAAGARAAIVLAGLRNTRDVAVRETVDEVMAALGR